MNKMNADEYREYRRKICRESQRKRRIKAREDGICIICCKRPVRDGRSTCTECSGHYGDVAYKKRQEYLERGMCLRCGKEPPMMYSKWCKSCAEIIAERRKAQKEREYDRIGE